MDTQSFEVGHLPVHSEMPAIIAKVQFALWGALTGYSAAAEYEQFLRGAADSRALPTVLVARRGDNYLGSVNLLPREMTIRPTLSPWMAQLFVVDSERRNGIGNALVKAAVAYASDLHFSRMYLYTSGTLPAYYRSHGWSALEEVEYLGKKRTVMAFDLV
ncbi:GNAT family N-acetyltransferase [Bradyrhizobium sp. HKCCYLRH3095]|uniref:GNAT family N-acetyltransferase n=1 Tax=Bradyrhizobium sp. HKCCYLRH3095 TaxID=3420765 RepID=UPI003EB9AA90